MTDLDRFETRLSDWMAARADVATRPFDAAAVARSAASGLAGRQSRWRPVVSGRTVAPRSAGALMALLLLAMLAAGAVLVGSQLLAPSPGPLIPADRGVFTPTGSMTFGRENPAAVLLGAGRVAVMGGYGGRRPGSSTEDDTLSSIEIWDPTTGSFTPGGDLRETRWGAIAVLLRDGRVLVAGGYGSEGPVTSAEIWDPHTLMSTPTGPMAIGRYDTTALLLADGRVLVLGRAVEDDDTPRTGEVWDPATGVFGAGDSIPEASYPEGMILGDGRVLILVRAPHSAADGKGGYLDAEVWDPVTGTTVAAGSSVASHGSVPTTTLLADGRVLMAGGVAGSPAGLTADSAEIWDPASMTFEATGSMSVARNSHSATLLRDGRVLIAGASTAGVYNAGETAEVFEPLSGGPDERPHARNHSLVRALGQPSISIRRGIMLSHRLGPRMRIAIPVAVSITWVLTSGSLGASPAPAPSAAQQPWIVYHWGHLGLVHPDGSGDQQIASEFSWNRVDEGAYFGHPQNPDWSPDGLRIAFNGERAGDPREGLPIWSWDLEAGAASALVPCTGTCQLVWSPDGGSIAYGRYDGPDPDPDTLSDRTSIEVMDLTSGEARTVFEWRLGDPGPARSLWCPRWSPDARSLVISIFRFADDAQTQVLDSAIAIVDAAGPPDQEPFMLTDWSLLAGYADWSPVDDLIVAGDRTLSLYRQETEPVNLFAMRADGTGFRWITDFGDHDVRATQPTWTQDGSRIVFTHVSPSGDPDGLVQLATIGPDGQDMELIRGVQRAQGRLQPQH